MESLKTLASSLESNTSNVLEDNEKNITRDFRAAALSLTTLYKVSIEAHKRSFDSGYLNALHDVLNFIQHGVSSNSGREEHPSGMDGNGITIGRVMDFVEARLEAIGTPEEDVQSEDDKTVKQGSSGTLGSSQPDNAISNSIGQPKSLPKDHIRNSQTSSSISIAPASRNRSLTPTIHSTSSSPNIRTQPLPIPRRALRGRTCSKETLIQVHPAPPPLSPSSLGNSIPNSTPAPTPFNFTVPESAHFSDGTTTLEPSSGAYHGLGKRRHAPVVEVVESAFGGMVGPAPTNGVGSHSQGGGNSWTRSQKRRTRHGHGHPHGQNINQVHGHGAKLDRMEVEEDVPVGRERKRVTRR